MTDATEKADKGEAAQRRLEKKSSVLFLEHWADGSRPMNWLAEWEYLTLTLYNLAFNNTEVLAVRPSMFDLEPGEFLRFYEGDRESAFSSEITPSDSEADTRKAQIEATRAYKHKLLNETFVRPTGDGSRLEITADFEAEDRRSLGFVEHDREPHGYARRGKISITSSEKLQRGYLYVVDEDEEKRERKYKAGTIKVQIFMPLVQVQRFEQKIRAAQPKAECTAFLQILVFQSEVDRSLAEPYHSQTYYVEPRSFAPVILNGVRVSERVLGFTDAPDEEEVQHGIDGGADEKLGASRELSDLVAVHANRLAAYMRLVTVALWAIVVAIIVSALL